MPSSTHLEKHGVQLKTQLLYQTVHEMYRHDHDCYTIFIRLHDKSLQLYYTCSSYIFGVSDLDSNMRVVILAFTYHS